MTRRPVPENQLPLPGFFPAGIQQTVMVPQRCQVDDNPFYGRVLNQLTWLQRHDTQRVTSVLLADMLNMNDRTLRYHLQRMEAAGLVARPDGTRSGWKAMLA